MNKDDAAADWVVGGPDAAGRAALERRLRHDPALAATVAELEATLAPLAVSGPDIPPPAAVWQGIMAALDAEAATLQGTQNLRLDAGEWQTIAPGVNRKLLWGPNAFLIRIDAGASIPRHGHGLTEHCVVIEGPVRMGGAEFHAGDYHAAPAGHDHVPISAPNGGLLLILEGD